MNNKIIKVVISLMSILLIFYVVEMNYYIFIYQKGNHGLVILNWIFYILFFIPPVLTYLFTKWRKLFYFIFIVGIIVSIENYVLESHNIFMDYETWIEKGMPNRPLWSILNL